MVAMVSSRDPGAAFLERKSPRCRRFVSRRTKPVPIHSRPPQKPCGEGAKSEPRTPELRLLYSIISVDHHRLNIGATCSIRSPPLSNGSAKLRAAFVSRRRSVLDKLCRPAHV